jgi:hypothetical protein
MAEDASSRRHFFRDLPSAIWLLGGAVIGIGILAIIFPYWSPLVRERTARPPPKHMGPKLNKFGFDQRYAGTIITGSLDGEKCQELIFDNRNRNMWFGGYVDCDAALRQFLQQDHPKDMDKYRIREVGKAFRHELN